MSKKDKAKRAVVSPDLATTPTLADLLRDAEGVAVTDEKRLRILASERKTLVMRVANVKSILSDHYNVSISTTYGDADALGCVWNDVIVTNRK